MKIGFLGTGMIVKDLMRTVERLPFAKKYILGTEATREETEQLAADNGFDGTFYDYDALLAGDTVDTIYVALPNFLHYSFARKALLAGKHVIIEKPITANIEELNDLKNIAEEKRLMLFEAMNIAYLPAYKKLKANLGRLGDIRIISLNYSQYSSRYDSFKNGVILPAFDYHKAGGALMDLNVYNIHFVVGIFGRPKNVAYHANIEKGIDTSGILTMDYGTFKVVAIGAKDCKAPILSTIQGDLGCIEIHKPANQLREFEIISNALEKEVISCDESVHRLYYEFMTFIKAVDRDDYALMKQMLEISTIVSEIMTEARHQAGIVFDNDNRKG